MKIEIREISFAYHAGEPVLDHATALPQENSISILAGVNGCGKSTLLKTAAGILRPNSGSILLDGIPLKQIPPREVARNLAYLPQNPLVPESFTVEELLSCARYPHQSSAAVNRKIISESMETLGITALAQRQLSQLSGGEKQRVFLSFVLIRQAKVWLLDEPFSALDPAAFRELFELLIKLKQQHALTVVIVLHDINRALAYGERIIGMKNGKINFDLPADSAIAQIRQLYDLPESALQCKPVFL